MYIMKNHIFTTFILIAGLILLLTGCPTPEQPHVHTYATAWTHSTTEHWHASSCGHADAVSGKAAHTWSAYASNNDATCEADGTKTRTCTVCGRTETIADEESQTNVHTYATAWTHSATDHWHAATCSHTDQKDGVAAHTFVEGVCSVCGYDYILTNYSDLSSYLGGLSDNTKDAPYRIAVVAASDDADEILSSIKEALSDNSSKYVDLELAFPLTSIGDSALCTCNSLVAVTIPSGVTSIGDAAFWACRNLTSVTIPASVTSIGETTFESCSSLTSVTIPSGVISIGKSAFFECENLTSVILPDTVTSIGEKIFYSCTSLTSVTIPASVTSIGNEAFYHCSSLTSVTIPASVTSIGKRVFDSCSSLTSVTIPASVTSIGDEAFFGCSSLTSVTIPASVTSIGKMVFASCSSLTSVTIPGLVTSIGNYAFNGCSSLTSITFAGTTEQWAAVTKGTYWNSQVPATAVTCSDGTAAL